MSLLDDGEVWKTCIHHHATPGGAECLRIKMVDIIFINSNVELTLVLLGIIVLNVLFCLRQGSKKRNVSAIIQNKPFEVRRET